MTIYPDIMNTDQAAAYLQLEPTTLEHWRLKKIGPRFARLSSNRRKNVVYRKKDLDAWIESRLVENG